MYIKATLASQVERLLENKSLLQKKDQMYSYRLISSSTDAYFFAYVRLNKVHGTSNCELNVGAE
jgi:hypothetical protein